MNERMNDETKQMIKWVLVSLGSVIAVALLVKLLVIPMIVKSAEGSNGGKTILGLFLFIMYFVNYFFNSTAVRKLEEAQMSYLGGLARPTGALLLIPVIADYKLIKTYKEYQEYELERLGPITPLINFIVSIIHVVCTFIVLPMMIKIEGLDYETTEVMFAFLLSIATLALLSNTRGLVMANIIDAYGDRTYMASPRKYKKFVIFSIGVWLFLFIGTLILSFIGINISHPLLNVIGIILPITILPIYINGGVKAMKYDLIIAVDETFDFY